MERLLQELPGPSGLSRTERQVLTAVEQGHITPESLFGATQEMVASDRALPGALPQGKLHQMDGRHTSSALS